MPRRLYRFTTERRTSVNRYLLTLDFPWPPRSRPLPSRTLFSSSRKALSRRVSFSRFPLRHRVLRLPSSDLPPSGRRRHPPPEGQKGREGCGQPAADSAERRGACPCARCSYENIWNIFNLGRRDNTAGRPRRTELPFPPHDQPPSRIYVRADEAGVCVRVCMCVCARGVVRRHSEDCALALSTDAGCSRGSYQDRRGVGRKGMNTRDSINRTLRISRGCLLVTASISYLLSSSQFLKIFYIFSSYIGFFLYYIISFYIIFSCIGLWLNFFNLDGYFFTFSSLDVTL